MYDVLYIYEIKLNVEEFFFSLAVTYPGEILVRIRGMGWVLHEARYHDLISEQVTVFFHCLFHT